MDPLKDFAEKLGVDIDVELGRALSEPSWQQGRGEELALLALEAVGLEETVEFVTLVANSVGIQAHPPEKLRENLLALPKRREARRQAKASINEMRARSESRRIEIDALEAQVIDAKASIEKALGMEELAGLPTGAISMLFTPVGDLS
jgi:hypothetical protein